MFNLLLNIKSNIHKVLTEPGNREKVRKFQESGKVRKIRKNQGKQSIREFVLSICLLGKSF